MKFSLQDEIAKLKTLTFKEKLDHIWEYYKVPIFAFVLLLVIVGSMINAALNPRPDVELFIAWNSDRVITDNIEELSLILLEHLEFNPAEQDVVISWFPVNPDDPQMQMASIQRMTAMLSIGGIELFVLNEDQLHSHVINGVVVPLEEMLNSIRAMNPTVYEIISERTVKVTYEDFYENTVENIMAIDITGAPMLHEIGFGEIDFMISLAVNATFTDHAKQAIIALFE
jgi:hypothetical protein